MWSIIIKIRLTLFFRHFIGFCTKKLLLHIGFCFDGSQIWQEDSIFEGGTVVDSILDSYEQFLHKLDCVFEILTY